MGTNEALTLMINFGLYTLTLLLLVVAIISLSKQK